MPVSGTVTKGLVITVAPCGMRARTASRAASRSSTTSTLNPCSSRAVTADAITGSSGSVVNRSGVAVVLIGWAFLGDRWKRQRTLPRLYFRPLGGTQEPARDLGPAA